MKYAPPCIQTRPGRGRSDAAKESRFVSGYRRGDGVGPRERRPKRLDLAWHSLETNEVGRHELARRRECVGTEPCSRSTSAPAARSRRSTCSSARTSVQAPPWPSSGPPTARPIRSMCACGASATRWTDRGSSAIAAPRTTARSRAKWPRQCARWTRVLELVARGSSAGVSPTVGVVWERLVLEHTYEDVDFISCHAYHQERDGEGAASLPRRWTWTRSSSRWSPPRTR